MSSGGYWVNAVKHCATVPGMSRRRIVLHSILCLAGRMPPISDEQDRILTDVYLLCDDLRTRRHRRTEWTNLELAAKYQISPRTVTNWRREGCPFAGGRKGVLLWLTYRRYAPAGIEAKFGAGWRLAQARGFLKDVLAADRSYALRWKELNRSDGVPVPDWARRYRNRVR